MHEAANQTQKSEKAAHKKKMIAKLVKERKVWYNLWWVVIIFIRW